MIMIMIIILNLKAQFFLKLLVFRMQLPPWNTQPLHAMCLSPWAAAAAAAAAGQGVSSRVSQSTPEQLAEIVKNMNRWGREGIGS